VNNIYNAIPNFEIYLEHKFRKCLWCLNTIQKTTRYHIIPAYLTIHQNHEYVMPDGVVCETCNNKFSIAEGKFVEFFQERLVFFNFPKRNGTARSSVTSPIYRYVSVSPGKTSFDLNKAGITDTSARIMLQLKSRGFDSIYYQNKISRDSNLYKRGLIHCVVAKIALESLYCYLAEMQGDKAIYEQIISNQHHNFHKHRESIYNFVNEKSDQPVNNVLMIGSYKNKYSDWNLNHNYITISHVGEYPVIWVRILGLLFLVNYLPDGNKSLTKDQVWKLVTDHNNSTITAMIEKGKEEDVESDLHPLNYDKSLR